MVVVKKNKNTKIGLGLLEVDRIKFIISLTEKALNKKGDDLDLTLTNQIVRLKERLEQLKCSKQKKS